jgi:hypothetical protein
VISSVASFRQDCQASRPSEAAIIHPMAEAKIRLRDEANKDRERSCNHFIALNSTQTDAESWVRLKDARVARAGVSFLLFLPKRYLSQLFRRIEGRTRRRMARRGIPVALGRC